MDVGPQAGPVRAPFTLARIRRGRPRKQLCIKAGRNYTVLELSSCGMREVRPGPPRYNGTWPSRCLKIDPRDCNVLKNGLEVSAGSRLSVAYSAKYLVCDP